MNKKDTDKKLELISLSASVSDVVAKRIEKQFGKSEKNKTIAYECLALCEEWTVINQESITESHKTEKASCKKYVKDNLKTKGKYGNFLINALISVLIKLIIEWVVENYIRRLMGK